MAAVPKQGAAFISAPADREIEILTTLKQFQFQVVLAEPLPVWSAHL
jgi:hypothetical protein